VNSRACDSTYLYAPTPLSLFAFYTSPMTTAAARDNGLGSVAETNGYRVRVEPAFVPEQSDETSRRYVYQYQVHVSNVDGAPATLRSRHWVIIDGLGRREEVKGEGVVGRQPLLQPGQTFAYRSFCPLNTPWGTMEGSYQLQGADGAWFEVKVGRFYLVAPTGRTPLPRGEGQK
jgi:ApaG protein